MDLVSDCKEHGRANHNLIRKKSDHIYDALAITPSLLRRREERRRWGRGRSIHSIAVYGFWYK